MTKPAALPSAATANAAPNTPAPPAHAPRGPLAPCGAVGRRASAALSLVMVVGAALAGGCYEERIISSTGPGSERDVIQSPAQQDYWIDNQIFGPRQSTTNREPVTIRGSR